MYDEPNPWTGPLPRGTNWQGIQHAAPLPGVRWQREQVPERLPDGTIAWNPMAETWTLDLRPLLPLAAVLPAWWGWRWGHGRRRRDRIARGLCVRCGYDLRATPGRCPECGDAAAV